MNASTTVVKRTVFLSTDEVCAKLADALAGLSRHGDDEEVQGAALDALEWLREQVRAGEVTAHTTGNALLHALVSGGKTLK